MKKSRAILFFFVYSTALFASTALERFEGKVTLKASGSPYLVTSSLVLSSQDTLIIEPGVELLVQGYRKLLLRGVVKIKGTLKKPVRMASADSNESWVGLHISTGNNPVEIQGLQVENAFRNIVSASKGKISQSQFVGNYYGLWVEKSPEMFLKECEFRENRFGVSVADGVLSLSKSQIHDNVFGAWLDRDASVVGQGNLIQSNQTADISAPSDSTRQGNAARFPKGTLQTVESQF